MRAPFQVLVLPYRWKEGNPEYAVLKVVDGEYWQFVAGGGEDQETPLEAARRECREETGLEGDLLQLDSLSTLPRDEFIASSFWPEDIYVIPEHCSFQEGTQCLKWDSNRNALWELNQRLKNED